jgi:hypothetical protein
LSLVYILKRGQQQKYGGNKMNKKSGYALRIVLGGYLTYLGIRILSEMIQQRPSNMTLMSVLAVVFILVGVAYAGNAICKTFEIDIKKQIAKMIVKRKAEQKRKAEEAAVAKEMSQVTESTTTEVSDNTMPTMLSEEDRKKLEDAVSKVDFEEKTMQDSKAEAIEKTADSDSTENEAAEKTVSEEKVESVEKLATTTESEETPDEEIKAEGTPVEETPAQEEELTDTRVVDIFAELNEEPVSEDAENDFEEK